MRTTFIDTLTEIAERDPRVWLLCGDLGYSVLERFAERFPKRFVNVGVAEQNMTGIAAGLALSGKIVFTYSIANFPVMRCLEQIRNDVCYHNLNVKIVAVGGGYAYGSAGYSHHGVEDFAVLRVLPNMTVIAPADPAETRLATEAMAAHPGPCYLRLGKTNEPHIHIVPPAFEIGRAIPMRDGREITFVSTGAMLQTAEHAADALEKLGHSVQVLSMPTVQPLDKAAIADAVQRTGRIITLEEHGIGGLGSAVAEVIASEHPGVRFLPLHSARQAILTAGSQDRLRASQHLDVDSIVRAAVSLLDKPRISQFEKWPQE